MPRSQNGYSANDRTKIGTFLVPGTSTRLAVRKGNVATVLLYVASEFDRTVEDIDTPNAAGYRPDCLGAAGSAPSKIHDDWGYAPRNVRGSSTVLSNHASGTAIDLNATQHLRGVAGTFTADQKRAMQKILTYCEGTVRWGEMYRNAPIDGMHAEIVGSPAAVAQVARKIRKKYAAEAKALRAAKRKAALAAAKKKAAALLATRKRKAAAAAAAALLLAGGGATIARDDPASPAKPASVTTAQPVQSPTPAPTKTVKPSPPAKARPVQARTLRYVKGRPLMHGPDVGRVQVEIGFHGKDVDNRYGPDTTAGVKRWQKRHGLRQTGVFGRTAAVKAGWRFTG